MAALPAARSMPQPFAPVATVFGAMCLAVACVAWLLFFIHHISHAISVNYIVDRIAAETEAVIDETMPSPRKPKSGGHHGAIASIAWDSAIGSDESGYIRFIDVSRLFELARAYRVRVQVLRRVGHFVPAGVPLIKVAGADRLAPEASAEFRSAFDIGPARTLQQDIEFGVLQIVDIALRAISPAVNDPSTAINGIDQLSRILIRFATRQEPESVLFDLPGEARVIVGWINFDGLLESAFDQILHYGSSDRAVCLRLLRALGDIAIAAQDPHCRHSAIEAAKRVVGACEHRLLEADMVGLRGRLASMTSLMPEPTD